MYNLIIYTVVIQEFGVISIQFLGSNIIGINIKQPFLTCRWPWYQWICLFASKYWQITKNGLREITKLGTDLNAISRIGPYYEHD